MPETANQHARAAKKRKTREAIHSTDAHDSSFASAYRDSSDELRPLGKELLKQGIEKLVANGNSLNEIKQPPAIKVPQRPRDEDFPLKYPVDSSLREHRESIMSEIREAREKLLQWMRQELQALSASNVAKGSHMDADKKRQEVDGGVHVNTTSMQKVEQGDQSCETSKLEKRQDHSKHITSELQDGNGGHNNSAGDSIPHKNTGLTSSEPKNKDSDMTFVDASGVTNTTGNGLDQNLESHVNAKSVSALTKAGSSFHNAVSKLPAESKSALFDICFGVGSGDDAKDVEDVGGTLESGINIREGFDFNKASHDIQKGLDRLDRLRENKSPLFDMDFVDEESNEGNGLGCSLESATSSRDNSGFSKTSNGIQSGFGRVIDTGFWARFGQSKDSDGDIGVEGATNGGDMYMKVKKEVVGSDTDHATATKGLATTTFAKGTKSDEERRQVENVVGANLAPCASKENHVGATYSAQSMHPGDAGQQASISARVECGIKRTYGSALSGMESALESKDAALKVCHENPSFADVFNSATSSIVVIKNNAQVSAADKGKIGSLASHSGSSSLGMPSSSPSAWNTLPTSKNTVNHTVHDSKMAHLEYASRSKLGDAILGTGRTIDFSGFDPAFSYTSHFKPSTEMIGALQQEQVNASSMYFSSLCANNSGFLSSSNRVIGVQRPPSAPPSSSSALRPMMRGMPGHLAAHPDASNIHTFLGLGMNGVSAVSSGIQAFPGLYLQGNQQHSQGSIKHVPPSTAPMSSHQDSPAVQEKAVLELNF